MNSMYINDIIYFEKSILEFNIKKVIYHNDSLNKMTG